MPAIFILKKEPPKKIVFLKGQVFLMGDHIDINLDVF